VLKKAGLSNIFFISKWLSLTPLTVGEIAMGWWLWLKVVLKQIIT